MECSKYQHGCQESCHNLKFSHTDKILFTRTMILNKYFVTVARLLVSVIEMSLLKCFSVLLVKTELRDGIKVGSLIELDV